MGSPLQDPSQSNNGDDTAQPWADVLQGIPTQFHGEVTPALEKWHQQHQKQYEEIENKYSGWKPFIDQKINPVQVQSAWGLATALEQDPVETIKTIQAYLESQGVKFTQEEVKQAVEQTQQENQGYDPRFDELKKQQELMASVIVRNNQEKLAAQEDAKVAAEFDGLHKKMIQKHGSDFKEPFVGGLALATGMTLEQAAEAYYAEINSHVEQSHRPAPNVLGRGGGLPTSRPDVRTMNEKQLNDHALDIIRSMRRDI